MSRTLPIVLLVLILVATFWSTIHDHNQQVSWQKSIEALLTNPTARPDPWTGTMDNERTLKLCAAIGILAHDHIRQDIVISLLPEICK